MPSREEHAALKHRFTYHPPSEADIARHELLRRHGHSFAENILNNTPAGPEQEQALAKVEEAVFWSNAAIARHKGGSS